MEINDEQQYEMFVNNLARKVVELLVDQKAPADWDLDDIVEQAWKRYLVNPTEGRNIEGSVKRSIRR